MFFVNRKGQFFPYGDDNPTRNFPIVTLILIIMNIAAFVFTYFLSIDNFEIIIQTYGFTPAYPSIITIFTSMFLHGGIAHLFGNMVYLWVFGDNIEDRFGKVKFIIFYLLSGMAATGLHFVTNLGSAIPAIGASGAISGILGAYILLFPRRDILTSIGYSVVRIPAYLVIGFWFVLQFLLGTLGLFGGLGSGIAFWAHIGGFVFGFAFTLAFGGRRQKEAKPSEGKEY